MEAVAEIGLHGEAMPNVTEALQEVELPPNERRRAGVVVENRPPDQIVLTTSGSRNSHGAQVGVVGAHALTQRDGLETSWPEGKVRAQREFARSGLGEAHSFKWEAADEDEASGRAATWLGSLHTANDRILQLLRDPSTLLLEVAPEPAAGVVRISIYQGGHRVPNAPALQAIRDLSLAIVESSDEAPAPTSDS